MNKKIGLILFLIVISIGAGVLFITIQNNRVVNNNEECIITVFNQKYNVFSLRKTHPGGDVYICGTDMTNLYQSQHGNTISRLEQYKI